MRILYISPYPPAQDGIGTYTRALADEIRARGHDVRVAVPRIVPDQAPEVLGAVASGKRELALLRQRLAAWNPDLIHLQFAVPAFGVGTARLLRRLAELREAGTPLVATLHEVTRDIALLRGAGRSIYRRIAENCDRIIVHTSAARTVLVERVGVPGHKVQVIPHPSVRPSAVGSTAPELRARFGLGEHRILLAFGFIHVDKGLDDLVRAVHILHRSSRESLDGARVVVAGAVRPRQGFFRIFEARDHIHFARVLREVRRQQLTTYFSFTGYVTDSDLAGWFHNAAALVLPYRRTEQSGVAALADAFDVPVLASAVGGLAERYAGSRWMFPQRDPAALAQVMKDFLSAPPEELAIRRHLSRESDPAAVVSATLDVYQATERSASHRLTIANSK